MPLMPFGYTRSLDLIVVDVTQERKSVILPLFGDTGTAQPSSGNGGSAPQPEGGIVLVTGQPPPGGGTV